MLNIESIKDGIVIDHIKAGLGAKIFSWLGLDKAEYSVALIINAPSKAMGKKDIIKIDNIINIDYSILGFIDPNITVNIIKNGEIVEKKHVELPQMLKNVICCKNPRCISSCEQELPHIFKLTDKENRVYRCLYCETKAK